jgi:MFS family permease
MNESNELEAIMLNQSELSDEGSLPRYLPWLVVFSASLFFFYEFIQMQMFNTISHFIIADFKITATTLGYISSGYFLADILFLFPAGMLIDRYSSRKVILAAMWISVISTAIFASSHNIVLAALCHFAAGIGNAFCFICCMRLASRWFPPRLMALVVGLIVTVAFFGGMVAQTPLAWLTTVLPWREAVMIVSGLGLAIIFIVWLYVQDYPPNQTKFFKAQKIQLESLGVKRSITMALSNMQNWWCGLYTSFINVPLMLLGGLWGGMYLTIADGLTTLQASYVSSMIFFGSMIGCPILGGLSDYLAIRRMPMIIFAAICIPIMMAIVFIPHLSLTSLLILFFLLGFFTSSQIIGYPALTESNPKIITGTAMGLASVLIMGSPMIFEPVFGYLMDKNWDGKVVNGIHVYNIQAFHSPMIMLVVILSLGLLASLFVKETYAKHKFD